MVVDGYDFCAEINSDGGDMVIPEIALGVVFGAEARDDVGLADSSITDDDDFDHIVIEVSGFA